MLSYQHIYHAGNLADVHKHALLAWVLDYMQRKDKPISYFETHSGRGLYQLDSIEAKKTGEAAGGIARAEARGWFPADHPYAKALARVRAEHGAMAYPGSPLIAAMSLRPDDRAHLAELHPQEFEALNEAMLPYAAQCHHKNGFELALSMTPPTPRRGLMLIDPSWEIKNDYDDLPHFLYKIHRKWNVGILMVWYPILTSGVHVEMTRVLDACNFPGALRHEVRFPPVRQGHGMTGSGMFIVNAPFGLSDEAARLTRLYKKL